MMFTFSIILVAEIGDLAVNMEKLLEVDPDNIHVRQSRHVRHFHMSLHYANHSLIKLIQYIPA